MSMRYPGGLIASSPVNAAYPSGVWTQAQTQPYAAQNVWMRDQFWPNTTLLLQGNGTNGAQNNTFLDSSTNNFTITRNGNTTQGSFTPYEANGYWSNYFVDTSSSYLNIASSSIVNFGTGDFTAEAWVNLNVLDTSIDTIISNYNNGSNGGLGWYINRGTNGGIQVYSGNSLIANANSAVTAGTWNHVAICRASGTLRIFVNGAVVATASDSSNYGADNSATGVGGTPPGSGAGAYLPGYLSNVRVVKGTAVYTSNFTPSAAPLTAVTNTSLLTCQSNRFIDNSSNNFTITRNGDTSVQAFQPFPGATTWSGSVLGGSGYFDGSGDYLTAANNAAFRIGSGDFTIECWVYLTSLSNSQSFISLFNTNGTNPGYTLYKNGSTNKIEFYCNGGTPYLISTPAITTGQWTHLAVVRNGSSMVMYMNGASVATATNSSFTDETSNPLYIGARADALSVTAVSGYIADARIVKGTAVYTSAFTPPTAPLTAITNTSLLTNFTNAGIFDSATMNDLETVGNAQVSTSVVKYGTGSMAFDGSGDYLTAPYNPWMRLINADFTIEFWMRLGAAQANMGIVSSYENNNGWFVRLDTSIIRLWGGDGSIAVDRTYSFSTGVWYHVAITRSGNTVRVFVDGTQVGANATVSTATDTTTSGLQIGRTQTITNDFNGYIDDLRITKGAARYIGNFTPPVARMPQQ